MLRAARRSTIAAVSVGALVAALAVVMAAVFASTGSTRAVPAAQLVADSTPLGASSPTAASSTTMPATPVSAAAVAARSSAGAPPATTPAVAGPAGNAGAKTASGSPATSTAGGLAATPTVAATSGSPATSGSTATSAIAAGKTSGAAGSVIFGVVTDTTAEMQSFDSDAGKKATLYGSYDSFAYNSDFDASSASALVAQGIQPMVTWEPWDPANGTATQPAYSLSAIVNGNYDSYITRWASEIKAWGKPLWLRFAHEMNGNWYPWGAGVNGNTPAEYVAAWRHVHDLFQQVGATNVSWVWTPNVLMDSTPTIASLYPGDAYVNMIGVDGYNWGTSQSWGSTWQTPSQVFGPTVAALEQLSTRPIMIGETASTEVGGNKATWISQFFSYLASNPRIKAFVWFNLDKETDWRIESSPTAQSAFVAGVANARYS